MPFVRVGQTEMYYESYGEGPVVVLGHGVAGNHASWYNQIPTLSQSFRTVVFEHRGFGNTRDTEGFGRSAFVDDIEAFLDALDIERAALVGQSLCGGTFAGFASRRPERLWALTISASMVAMTPPDDLTEEIAANNLRTRDWPQGERVLGPTIRRDDPERCLLYMQLASFNAINIKTLKGDPVAWTPAGLAATGLPVQFIVGTDDPLCLPSIIRRVAERIPGCRYDEIADSGHSPYFEQPAAFNRVLVDFLSSVRPSS